jgi:hypothetical protein
MRSGLKITITTMLLLAAAVLALETEKMQQTADWSLNVVKLAVQGGSTLSVALLLGSAIYILLIKRHGLPELFGNPWFLVPFNILMAVIILAIVSSFSPEVKSIYDKITGGGCPFLYCPQIG